MKTVKVLILMSILALGVNAQSYIYMEEGVKLPLPSGASVYVGAPVKVVKEYDNSAQVRVEGYINPEKKDTLFATPNFKLVLAHSNEIKVEGEKGVLIVEVQKENLADNVEDAYWTIGDRFYEKCTQCHAAKVVAHHTMLEWEGLYASMKEFAKPSEEDTTYILRYLRAFAKDGIAKEAY